MTAQLDALAEEILEEGTKEAARILGEAEAETRKVLGDAEAEANDEASGIINSAKAEAESIRRKLLSEAKHRVRLLQLESRNSLVDEILKEAKKRVLAAATSSDALQRLVAQMAVEALRDFPTVDARARLNKSTANKLDLNRLKADIGKQVSGAKLEWSTDYESEENGIIIESRDGKIRAVNTLGSRFEKLEREILVTIRQTLFSE